MSTSARQAEQLVAILKELISEAVSEALREHLSNLRPIETTAAERPPNRPLIPIGEAAKLLGLARMTLYRMNSDGELDFVRLRGRTFVPTSEIDRLTATGNRNSTVEKAKPVRVKKVKLTPKV